MEFYLLDFAACRAFLFLWTRFGSERWADLLINAIKGGKECACVTSSAAMCSDCWCSPPARGPAEAPSSACRRMHGHGASCALPLCCTESREHRIEGSRRGRKESPAWALLPGSRAGSAARADFSFVPQAVSFWQSNNQVLLVFPFADSSDAASRNAFLVLQLHFSFRMLYKDTFFSFSPQFGSSLLPNEHWKINGILPCR